MNRLSHRLPPALRYRDYRLMWVGQLFSNAGSQMQIVALNYQIYQITGSPIALGLIGLFRVVPIIIFSLLGGLVADAVDRRRLMMITQTVLMGVALTLSLLTYTNTLAIWMIYALTSVGAAATAFDSPARQSIIPNLVPRRDFANAASLGTIAWQAGSIAGPFLAGEVIGRGGVAVVYFVNALSFLGILFALAAMQTRVAPAPGEKRDVSLAALKEGLRFVFTQPLIRTTMILDFIATFFAAANQLLPIFAQDILQVGPQGLGRLYGASALGAVVTSVALSLTPRLRKQGPLMLVAVGMYGLATVVFGVSRAFWLSFAALAVAGGADMISTVIRQTIRQLVTPDRLRGRMVSVNMIFFMGGPQLGELEAGIVAALLGAPASVVIGGVACLLGVGAVALTDHRLRQYDSEPVLETGD